MSLDLESAAGSATASSLELASLRSDEGLGLGTGRTGVTEVLVGLAGSAAALEQDGVGTGGGGEGELIEGHALTSGLDDAGAGSLSEAQSAHLEGGDLSETDIVGDGADDDGDLSLLTLHVSGEGSESHGRTVGSAHVQTAENNLGELSTSAASDEAVELRNYELGEKTTYLHQQGNVEVVALRSLTLLVSAVAASSNQINTLEAS